MGEKEGWGCAVDGSVFCGVLYIPRSCVSLWTRYKVYMVHKEQIAEYL